ncbi:MAG: ABC transporter permease [Clostridia bacterium]|nr:ABC transporter permease [Clostridia bacterium]
MIAIFKREFKSYFHNLTGFVFIAVYLLALGFFVSSYNLKYANSSITYALSDMSLAMIVVTPIITMRVISGDRRSGASKLLYSLPISSSEIVLGKYSALIAVFAIPTAATALVPLLLNFFGDINFVSSYGALTAFFLFGMAIISICTFISSLSDNIVVCGIVSYITLIFLYFANAVTALLPEGSVWAEILSFISLFGAFDKFIYGIFDLKAVIYYISLTVIFVFLTVRSVEKKRFA